MRRKASHHKEKPITPRMPDTIPPISNNIAEPPDHLVFSDVYRWSNTLRIRIF
jgi:hypothetical protein